VKSEDKSCVSVHIDADRRQEMKLDYWECWYA